MRTLILICLLLLMGLPRHKHQELHKSDIDVKIFLLENQIEAMNITAWKIAEQKGLICKK